MKTSVFLDDYYRAKTADFFYFANYVVYHGDNDRFALSMPSILTTARRWQSRLQSKLRVCVAGTARQPQVKVQQSDLKFLIARTYAQVA
jgi:hypothetical protein